GRAARWAEATANGTAAPSEGWVVSCPGPEGQRQVEVFVPSPALRSEITSMPRAWEAPGGAAPAVSLDVALHVRCAAGLGVMRHAQPCPGRREGPGVFAARQRHHLQRWPGRAVRATAPGGLVGRGPPLCRRSLDVPAPHRGAASGTIARAG